jgi:predicted nucleotidyltransferase
MLQFKKSGDIDHPYTSLLRHQATLDRFLAACRADPHILAATLYGSHARGAADEWSDLDIGVVITDDAYDDFLTGREAFLRLLGEPLFVEDFDIPGILFFILADGTEGELSIDRASDFTEPHGPWIALVDKVGILDRNRVSGRNLVSKAEGVETLRLQITWFWHDLSHFTTAMARGQLWWAAGQLENLRRTVVILARLRHDFNDEDATDDPYFKLDKALPNEALAPLRATFVPLERAALFEAARAVIGFYRQLALPLVEENGLLYPVELERLMLDRLEQCKRR